MRTRLLSLYPEAWRERYGEEMSALLAETAPTIRITLDLLRGALAAHLRPLAGSPPAVRARGAVVRILGCSIVFCVFGGGFAKTTENFAGAARLHPVLAISHWVIVVAGLIGGGALAVAATPLAIASIAEARRTGDTALRKLIALPPAAIAIFAGSLALLGLWLKSHHSSLGAPGWLLFGFCLLCGVVAGIACWAAPRAIMRRADLPRRAFALSVPAMALVALCLVAIAVATGVFLIGIVADAPGLGSAGNGPGGLIDVTVSVAVQLAAMLALSALAVLSAARGVRALRAS